MTEAPVLFERLSANHGAIGLVTLNSEKTLNSLSLPMIDLLTDQLAAWRDEDEIVAVVLQGAGDRAFSAGGDIQDLYRSMCEHPGGPNPYAETFFEREYRLDYMMHTYPKPLIAWAHGFVMGGGLGVMAACSNRIGTEQSRVGMPEITIGLFPDAGATWFLAKMAPDVAHFLAWTGSHLGAIDAKEVGLVDHLVSIERKGELMDALLAAAWTDVDAKNRVVVDDVIKGFGADAESFPDSMLDAHRNFIAGTAGLASNASRPALAFDAALADFATEDKWLAKAIAGFRAGSPTTAHIIAEQITRARGLSLKQTFMLEFNIALQCSRHPDFVEGIRALLIDRDNQPAWKYKQLIDVPVDWVEAHFELPLSGSHPLADLPESTH